MMSREALRCPRCGKIVVPAVQEKRECLACGEMFSPEYPPYTSKRCGRCLNERLSNREQYARFRERQKAVEAIAGPVDWSRFRVGTRRSGRSKEWVVDCYTLDCAVHRDWSSLEDAAAKIRLPCRQEDDPA